jgi:hypothetical protein
MLRQINTSCEIIIHPIDLFKTELNKKKRYLKGEKTWKEKEYVRALLSWPSL